MIVRLQAPQLRAIVTFSPVHPRASGRALKLQSVASDITPPIDRKGA